MPTARRSTATPSRRRGPLQRRLRPQLPSETPAVVGFQQYARFERSDYAQNCQRCSVLAWQPLLWGGVALVRSRGRLGRQGSQRLEGSYPDRQSAQLVTERRYELIDCT